MRRQTRQLPRLPHAGYGTENVRMGIWCLTFEGNGQLHSNRRKAEVGPYLIINFVSFLYFTSKVPSVHPESFGYSGSLLLLVTGLHVLYLVYYHNNCFWKYRSWIYCFFHTFRYISLSCLRLYVWLAWKYNVNFYVEAPMFSPGAVLWLNLWPI